MGLDAASRRRRTGISEGRTVLHVVVDGAVAGIVAVEDEIRPESKEAVDALHALGVRVAMITGDSQAVADSVARRLGIDEVAAQVLPADKAAAVKRFQEGGRKVAMVGDGVNDAPALATADVGIAIGAGTDVAVESAGIVLVRSDPRDVVAAIELSRATYSKMVQNLVWATGYNLVAIPVAMGIFVPWGIDLPMAARCHRHEPLDDHRGGQRPTPAPCPIASRQPAIATRQTATCHGLTSSAQLVPHRQRLACMGSGAKTRHPSREHFCLQYQPDRQPWSPVPNWRSPASPSPGMM